MVLRWSAFLVCAFCLAWTIGTWTTNGVALIGVIAWFVFLATFGVFTRRFWFDAAITEDLSETDAAIDGRAS